MNVVHFAQLDKDTILLCAESEHRLRFVQYFWAGRPRPWHNVLDGDPAFPPPKGAAPQFSAAICCGQMAAWIKMPLGMELGLSPGDFVLDGVPARPLNFLPMFIIVIVLAVLV